MASLVRWIYFKNLVIWTLGIFVTPSVFAEVSPQWSELKTTSGCIFYEWDTGWDWSSIIWTGKCVPGKPIEGKGTITRLAAASKIDGFWWATAGNYVGGYMHGAIASINEQFPDPAQAMIIEYKYGCKENAPDCTPRIQLNSSKDSSSGHVSSNTTLSRLGDHITNIKTWGNKCVILDDVKINVSEAGTTSDWVKTTFMVKNVCNVAQHFEFMVGEKDFGKPSRPIFENTVPAPVWPDQKPRPALPFVPLVQIATSMGLIAGQTATATLTQSASRNQAPPPLIYKIASCDTYSGTQPIAAFRDAALELGWLCIPVK